MNLLESCTVLRIYNYAKLHGQRHRPDHPARSVQAAHTQGAGTPRKAKGSCMQVMRCITDVLQNLALRYANCQT